MKNNILTDTLLYDALEIYNNEWVTSEEFNKEKFETSEKFNKKMQKMIKSRTNLYHKATLTGLRRAVCVIAAILTLMLSTLSVGAVRDAIKDFVFKAFSTHDSIKSNHSATKDYPKTIEKVYELGYVPEGYELLDYSADENNVSYMYFFEDKAILFMQSTKDAYSTNVDNEQSTKSIETYDNQEYMVYVWNSGDIKIIWDNGEYIFSLFGTFNKEEAIDLCKSLKIKEN